MFPPVFESPAVLQSARWITAPLGLLDEGRRRYGDTFALRILGLGSIVIVSDPDVIRQMFTGDPDVFRAGEGRYFLRQLVGDTSILVLDGETHMRKRRLLLPPFHGERLHAYAETIRDATVASIKTWPIGDPFPLQPEMQRITLQVIVRAVFGLREDAEIQHFSSLLTRFVNIVSSPIRPILALLRINTLTRAPWLPSSKMKAEIDRLLFAEIARRRKAGGEHHDVLSLLLDARDEDGRPLTDVELRDELITVLLAGHETTATALAWTFGLMLAAPEVKARLDDELSAVIGDGPLDPSHLEKLVYLDAVIKESLRLRPIAPVVSRLLKAPFQVGPYLLPPGTRVTLSVWLTHQRKDLYPEPERFLPDRFIGKKTDPYAWFPFGGGVRRCLGMAFALYEMKVVLATVFSRVGMRLAPGPPPRPVRRSVTLAPSGGTRVVVHRLPDP